MRTSLPYHTALTSLLFFFPNMKWGQHTFPALWHGILITAIEMIPISRGWPIYLYFYCPSLFATNLVNRHQQAQGSTIRTARWPVWKTIGQLQCHHKSLSYVCVFKPCSLKNSSNLKAFGHERQLHSVLTHCALCEQCT